jgi:pimeloyl-ACP methyl ester carboxylesterase
MKRETHVDAPTRYSGDGNVRYTYRHFGRGNGVPALLIRHLNGEHDAWDPCMTGGLARGRPVVILDAVKMAESGTDLLGSTDAMAYYVAAFLRSIDLTQIDLLGFGAGGHIAQAVTLHHPSLVRRLILIGTEPRASPTTEMEAPSAMYLPRHRRRNCIDPCPDLQAITQPTLVVNRKNDPMIPMSSGFDLARRIPNAQLIVYPDPAGAPAMFIPKHFVDHARLFLEA